MDGRVKLMAPLLAAFLLAGCTSTQGSKKLEGLKPTPNVTESRPESKSTTPTAATPPLPTPTVAKKSKEGSKRPPSPDLVTSLAGIREDLAKKKKKDEPEQFVKMMDEARQLYQEALKLDADFVKAQEGLIRVYTQLGEHHKAQEVVRKALEQNPRDGRMWVELGMTYNRQKNYEEGLKAFRKALEVDPENRQFMQALGFTLVWSGRPHEGLDHLVMSMGRAAAHYNIAGILRQQNRLDEAQQHLKVCLEVDPNFERARDMLAQLRPDAVPAAPGATLPGVLPASTPPTGLAVPVAPAMPAPPMTPTAPARTPPAPEQLPSLGFVPLN